MEKKLRKYIEEMLDMNGDYKGIEKSYTRAWAFGAMMFAFHADIIDKETKDALYTEYFAEEKKDA